VLCHLCAVLGCVVHRGVEPLHCPPRARRRPIFPPAPGCTRLRDDYLLHPAARYSMRSNSQLDCWMRTALLSALSPHSPSQQMESQPNGDRYASPGLS